ncbi:MAG TPA: hypothetical protein PL124_11720 [Candidatus Cloacimonadota bacterium]|nr:hypothetical protein [Candidatus Cloacimonadota bacterium]
MNIRRHESLLSGVVASESYTTMNIRRHEGLLSHCGRFGERS